MIEEARQYIKESLAKAVNPALLCSFGKESMLLLHLARRIRPDITIIWFGDKLPALAEMMIKKDTAFGVMGYPPADRYFVQSANGYSLVDEYSFAGTRVPMISDVVEGECELKFPMQTLSLFRYNADVTLWGYRSADSHPLVNTTFPQRFQLGTTVMDAPLWSWSETDVYNALDKLQVPYEPATNHIAVCGKCLEQIGAAVGEESLRYFQERFNFGGH